MLTYQEVIILLKLSRRIYEIESIHRLKNFIRMPEEDGWNYKSLRKDVVVIML